MHKNPSWIIVSEKTAVNISYQALIPAVILTALALVAVILRWYARVRVKRTWGVGDVVVTMALVFSMAYTGVVGGEFGIDMTSTSYDVKASGFATMTKLMFAGSIFYYLAVNFVRFSILFQYQRLFRDILPFRICISVVGAATIGAMTWGVFGIVFLCRPVRKYWEGDVSGKCMDAGDHFWSCSLIGIVLDFVIWVMSMPVLRRLRLEGKQKIGLLVVPFVLGLFVCIVSILRIVHVHSAARKGDVSKSGSYAAIWSTAEVNVAIICSSLLVMEPFLVRIIPCLGADSRALAREEDGVIRRIMSIATLEESLADTEATVEAWCEVYIWSNSSSGAGEGRSRTKKESA